MSPRVLTGITGAVLAPALLLTCTGCGDTDADLPKAGAVSSPSVDASPSSSPSASGEPDEIPTSYPRAGATFTLPEADGTAREAIRAYVGFEVAFRTATANAKMSPQAAKYAAPNMVTFVRNNVADLHKQHTRLRGPWTFEVSDVQTAARVGRLKVCIGGGKQVVDGKPEKFTGQTLMQVSLSASNAADWRVVNYKKEASRC